MPPSLIMAIVGFLPPDDARLLATIDASWPGSRTSEGLLFRYVGDDGIERRRRNVLALHLLAGPRTWP